jgi:carboxymethylenebutenolidase
MERSLTPLALDGSPNPAVLALPDGEGPVPGVVVVHDITGFRADTRRHCARFAAEGFAAAAPDLYMGGRPSCVVRTLTSLLRGEGEGLQVIEATRAALAAHPRVDPDRIGIIGFCMGGGFALMAAADGPYAVAGPFYGTVPRSAERLRGLCPTLAQFGQQDLAFRSHAARLGRHLEALGIEHELVMHEGVGHSFMNAHEDPLFSLGRLTPLRARHDAAVEADAWARLLRWFRAHLDAPE